MSTASSTLKATVHQYAFLNPADYKKALVIFLLMCSLAHVRRKEIQKRWLKPDQEPKWMDHPIVPYVLENSAIHGLAYCITRFFPNPTQKSWLLTFVLSVFTSTALVEPLILFEKFTAKFLYKHVSYFATRAPPEDFWTIVKDYSMCNLPAMMAGAVVVTTQLTTMPSDKFETLVLNPKPIELVPYLINALDIFLEAFFPAQSAIMTLQALGIKVSQIEQVTLLVSLIYFESASHTGKEVPTVSWFPLLSPLPIGKRIRPNLLGSWGGVKSALFLLFLAFLGFCVRFTLVLANGLDSPLESQQLFNRLGREASARAERLAKRDLDLIATAAKMSEEERLEQVQLKIKQAKLDAEIPEWATPRAVQAGGSGKQIQVRKKPVFDVEFEESEKLSEEAEREIRTMMGGWLKDLELVLDTGKVEETATFQKLKKRQEFVDSVLDSVLDIPDLDFDLSVFKLESAKPIADTT
ncbi:hypothetical protein BASA81_009816 [Batrachochytrium salamandrivorans]|nr:hypothetical protein BASA81_009816 [Batrachochytrium salamandrivorans]